MQVKIPHSFGKHAAIARVKAALIGARPQLAGKVSITEERWDGDTLHFAFEAQGQKISGTLGVGEKEFDLYVKLPLMYKLFEGRIEKMISEQAAQLLGGKKL